MKISIETLIGKTIVLDVEAKDTIVNVKQMIRDKEHIPVLEQTLIIKRKLPRDDQTLADCNVENDGILHLVIRKCSGPSTQ
jgi:Ubiquitin family